VRSCATGDASPDDGRSGSALGLHENPGCVAATAASRHPVSCGMTSSERRRGRGIFPALLTPPLSLFITIPLVPDGGCSRILGARWC